MIGIGNKVLVDGKKVTVQDSNNLAGQYLVGIPDVNGIVWEPWWIRFDEAELIKEDIK